MSVVKIDAPVTVGGDTPRNTGMLASRAQDRHLLCHVPQEVRPLDIRIFLQTM